MCLLVSVSLNRFALENTMAGNPGDLGGPPMPMACRITAMVI